MDLRSPPSPAPTSKGRANLLLILGLQLLLLGLVASLVFASPQSQVAPESTGNLRKIASKLRAAGAIDEAAALYTQVLNSSPAETNRTQIAYSLAELYIESAQFEKALRWLYEAEISPSPDLKSEVAAKIVYCLERLGRVHAAKAALNASTQITSQAPVNRSADDVVVAKIGNQEIYYSELQRALDDLPPELSKQFGQANGKPAFLKKYVADELMWRKAQKLQYDQDPETQRQLSSLVKHIVVGKFVEKEVAEKIEMNPADVKNFYEANKERFKKDNKQLSFQEAQEQVTASYRMMKMQAAYGQMIENELAAGDVSLYTENLPKQ